MCMDTLAPFYSHGGVVICAAVMNIILVLEGRFTEKTCHMVLGFVCVFLFKVLDLYVLPTILKVSHRPIMLE